jgi:hypothetical protein
MRYAINVSLIPKNEKEWILSKTARPHRRYTAVALVGVIFTYNPRRVDDIYKGDLVQATTLPI